MGSPCSLSLFCSDKQNFEKVTQACIKEVDRLEKKYSRYRTDSLATQINKAAGSAQTFELDSETWALLSYANTAFEQSDGLFDITSGVLRKAWNFKSKQIPTEEQLSAVLSLVGWRKVQLNQKAFCLPEKGMEIDFGGIVKEYAADVLVSTIKSHRVNHGMIDLGGDIAVSGPQADGTPWRVGIRHPLKPGQAMATIQLDSGGLASSGDYERCFELNGVRYSHLLNPKTGWPVQGISAVSVSGPACVLAGSVSTISMLKPTKDGLDWLEKLGLPFVAIDQDGNVYPN